ncbi:MAG: IS66 family insertion sequence element accessory protein TnpB [Bdellovibrionales bacterium]|nr:IS66 family insertion sequence element accessory protein TnpB [Bdellovibrionales bacterium]
MSLSFRPGHRIFVFNELIDMRSGFSRLSMLVRDRMQQKILEGDLFVFLGQNRKRLKALCFDGTGLILLSKRLEIGRFMRVSDFESFDITVEELHSLLRGGTIRRAFFGDRALTRMHGGSSLVANAAARSGTEYRSPS